MMTTETSWKEMPLNVPMMNIGSDTTGKDLHTKEPDAQIMMIIPLPLFSSGSSLVAVNRAQLNISKRTLGRSWDLFCWISTLQEGPL